jgi:hypothetical protein
MLILNIHDVIVVKGKGLVIAGTNPQLDNLSNKEIVELVGNQIEIHSLAGQVANYQVLGVEISTSISGGKNIFILLPESVMKNDIKLNSTVYVPSAL